ncbi:MAG: anti-sigma factor family protein, partial [Planctomycetota bacterium]
MNCRSAKRLLPLHCGGDLPLPKAERLGQHLSGCPACRRELEAYRSMRRFLAPLREEAPLLAPGLWDRLEPRLEAVDAAMQLRRPWYRRSGVVTSLAAGFLGVVLLPFLLRDGAGQESLAGPRTAGPDLAALPAAAGPQSGPDEGLRLL